MLIQRHECKYLITEARARAVHASIAPFVEPDPHARHRTDFTYPIASLYLDARGLPLYRETIEGQRNRYKLRVRCYADDDVTPVFLEVKRRYGGVIHKTRCRLARAQALGVLRGDLMDLTELGESRRRAHDDFLSLVRSIDARPTVIVRYDRQAYVGADNPGVRVTFDRRLRTAPSMRPELRLGGGGFTPVESRLVVLELKFNDRYPPWMRSAVHQHGLVRRSFSKYAHSIDSARRSAALTIA